MATEEEIGNSVIRSHEERLRFEHDQLHEKHKGHDKMHTEIVLILILSVVVGQIALVEWKKRWFKSYQMATLFGMWVIPIVISLYQSWWRFIIVWILFTVITLFILRKSTRQPIDGSTPRLVYKWFFLIYKTSYALGIFGYILLMVTIMGLNVVFNVKPHSWMDCGVMCLFYGLYFGVMGRDFAEICSDTVAARIGYYSSTGLPVRQLDPGVCAVCGNAIHENPDVGVENTYKLNCNHNFHEFCIRGWCIIGKKQICPYCKEKVDLKRLFLNPVPSNCMVFSSYLSWQCSKMRMMYTLTMIWERPHVMYGQLLDWIRYLVAWQPLILTCVQVINWSLGLE